VGVVKHFQAMLDKNSNGNISLMTSVFQWNFYTSSILHCKSQNCKNHNMGGLK